MKEFFQSELARDIFVIVILITAAIVLYFILDIVINRIFRKIAQKTETRIDDIIHKLLDRFLFRFILIGLLFSINSRLKEYVSEEITTVIHELLIVILSLFAIQLCIKIVNDLVDFYFDLISKRAETNLSREFGPLTKRLLQILLVIGVIIAILNHWGIDIKGLLVSLGVGSLALALAAQETLANMIAGFILMLDRPFRIGDRVRLTSGLTGDVYQIGLRSTKILDFENNLHIIPNHDLMKSIVVNLSYPEPRVRVTINVGVAYGSDLRKVKEIMLNSIKNHPLILSDPEPKVFFMNFGNSSLDLMGIGFVQQYKDAFQTGEDIRMAIYEEFNKHQIQIPFPQMDVHLVSKHFD